MRSLILASVITALSSDAATITLQTVEFSGYSQDVTSTYTYPWGVSVARQVHIDIHGSHGFTFQGSSIASASLMPLSCSQCGSSTWTISHDDIEGGSFSGLLESFFLTGQAFVAVAPFIGDNVFRIPLTGSLVGSTVTTETVEPYPNWFRTDVTTTYLFSSVPEPSTLLLSAPVLLLWGYRAIRVRRSGGQKL